MKPLVFSKVANGIFFVSLGTPSDLYPLHISAGAPRLQEINALPECSFPQLPFPISCRKTARELVIRLPAEADQDVYGLGLQPFSFNHKYRQLTLKIDGNPQTQNGECPAPVPLLVFPQGFAIAIDSLERPKFHLGTTKPMDLPLSPFDRAREEWWNGITPMSCMEIVIPGENADIYLFCGNDLKELAQRYVLYCGGGFLPPRTALGVWQRVHMNATDREVIHVIDEYRKRKNALNVIGMEPGWHEQYNYPCSYSFSKKRFPYPAAFVQEAKDRHAEINLWEFPGYAQGYPMYDALKPYGFGNYACANGAATDLTIPEAAKAIRDSKTAYHLSIGIAGYKTDADTPYPDHAELPSGMSGYEYRQIFAPLNMKNELEMFRGINRRTLGLTLGGNIGSCGFPHVYYNDSTNLENYVRLICNSGFCGLLWSPEMCSADMPDQWLRRIQLATFSANMQINGWWSASTPWEHPSVAETVRQYTILRTKLMPYFYQAFSRFYLEGIPPFRPLLMEENNKHTKNLDSQFMAGDDMVVAPMFYDQHTRQVYLPKGNWYTFDTNERYQGGKTYTVEAPNERIPVFVREGAMIPMLSGQPEYIPGPGEAMALEVLCFGKSGKLRLYDDDGCSFNYEKGDYGFVELAFDETGGRITADCRSHPVYTDIRFRQIGI